MSDQIHNDWAIEHENWKFLESIPNVPEELGFLASSMETQTLDPRKVLKTENQRNMGSCRGHSGSTGGEWLRTLATGEIGFQLSRMMMYVETQRIDGISGDRGSTIAGGLQLLENVGLCRGRAVAVSVRVYTTAAAELGGNFGRRSPASYRPKAAMPVLCRLCSMGKHRAGIYRHWYSVAAGVFSPSRGSIHGRWRWLSCHRTIYAFRPQGFTGPELYLDAQQPWVEQRESGMVGVFASVH